MGTRTEHAPGTFSWIDLSTSSTEGAKSFYGGLLGWEFEDNEIPEDAGGGVYTMCKVGGSEVAAIAGQQEGDPSPPHWNCYVTVASADESATKAGGLGANVIVEAFDVMDAGRMAVIADPTGAVFSVWEPKENIGAYRVNDPGCLTWNELHTPDPSKALEFYTALFGWNTERMDTPEGAPTYTIVKVGERSNGGVMDSQDGEPPNWLPYITVESRDSAAEKAKDLGASELARMDMEQGEFAVFTDPQGAAFAVFEGEVDD